MPELKKEINFIAQLYIPLDMLKIFIYSIIVSISSLIYAENDQYVLLVSMDGFRADYLEITDTPNFDKMAKKWCTVRRVKTCLHFEDISQSL